MAKGWENPFPPVLDDPRIPCKNALTKSCWKITITSVVISKIILHAPLKKQKTYLRSAARIISHVSLVTALSSTRWYCDTKHGDSSRAGDRIFDNISIFRDIDDSNSPLSLSAFHFSHASQRERKGNSRLCDQREAKCIPLLLTAPAFSLSLSLFPFPSELFSHSCAHLSLGNHFLFLLVVCCGCGDYCDCSYWVPGDNFSFLPPPPPRIRGARRPHTTHTHTPFAFAAGAHGAAVVHFVFL